MSVRRKPTQPAALPANVEGWPVNGRRFGPPSVWTDPRMRRALALRDIAAVYRLLQSAGVSQRRIAAATGQSQSEVSEILAGRRVHSVSVLERVADGLGVPRSWLGCGHDRTAAEIVGPRAQRGALAHEDIDELGPALRLLLTAANAIADAVGVR